MKLWVIWKVLRCLKVLRNSGTDPYLFSMFSNGSRTDVEGCSIPALLLPGQLLPRPPSLQEGATAPAPVQRAAARLAPSELVHPHCPRSLPEPAGRWTWTGAASCDRSPRGRAASPPRSCRSRRYLVVFARLVGRQPVGASLPWYTDSVLGTISKIICVLFVENSTKADGLLTFLGGWVAKGVVYEGRKNFSSFLDELENLEHFQHFFKNFN